MAFIEHHEGFQPVGETVAELISVIACPPPRPKTQMEVCCRTSYAEVSVIVPAKAFCVAAWSTVHV